MVRRCQGAEAWAFTVLRIVAGCAFFVHGAQKLLGWFGGAGPDGGTVELMSRFGVAGVVEFFAGFFLILGLFTRVMGLIASGEMAVAYFWMHAGRNGELLWWNNGGEVVMLFSFLWLYFALRGPGPFSLDAAWFASTDRPSVPVP